MSKENKKAISTIKCNKLNCRPVLEAQRCYTRVLSSPVCSFNQQNNSMINALQRGIMVTNFTVNFVCRQNVEGNVVFINPRKKLVIWLTDYYTSLDVLTYSPLSVIIIITTFLFSYDDCLTKPQHAGILCHFACAVSRDLLVGIKNNHIFGILRHSCIFIMP